MQWMIEAGLKRRGEPAPGQLEPMSLAPKAHDPWPVFRITVPISLSSHG